ncbi:hypothetical protein [Streptomyces canus]|uniref:hypothetical protein n=1 Tax=Streptomyces canus TaxID=58343 RepID=UPI003CF7F873
MVAPVAWLLVPVVLESLDYYREQCLKKELVSLLKEEALDEQRQLRPGCDRIESWPWKIAVTELVEEGDSPAKRYAVEVIDMRRGGSRANQTRRYCYDSRSDALKQWKRRHEFGWKY